MIDTYAMATNGMMAATTLAELPLAHGTELWLRAHLSVSDVDECIQFGCAKVDAARTAPDERRYPCKITEHA